MGLMPYFMNGPGNGLSEHLINVHATVSVYELALD